MKIFDLLEDTTPKFNAIFQTQYFKNYIAPVFDTIDQKFINEIKDEHKKSDHYTVIAGVYDVKQSLILHGSSKQKYSTGDIIEVGYRKFPTDSNQLIHNKVNEIAQEKLGAEIRSLLFGTFHYRTAYEYAQSADNIYIIIPEDGYTFFFSSEYEDFYVDYLKENAKIRGNLRYTSDKFHIFLNNERDNIYKVLEDSINERASRLNKQPNEIRLEIFDEIEAKAVHMFKTIVYDQIVRDNMINLQERKVHYADLTTDVLGSLLEEKGFTIPEQFGKSMPPILERVMESFIQELNAVFTDIAEKYVDTVVKTDTPMQIDYLAEIMIKTENIHMISLLDIVPFIEAYKGLTK